MDARALLEHAGSGQEFGEPLRGVRLKPRRRIQHALPVLAHVAARRFVGDGSRAREVGLRALRRRCHGGDCSVGGRDRGRESGDELAEIVGARGGEEVGRGLAGLEAGIERREIRAEEILEPLVARGAAGVVRAGDLRVRGAEQVLFHRVLRAALDGAVGVHEAQELAHARHGERAVPIGTRELIKLDGIVDLAGIAVGRGDAVEGLPEAGAVARRGLVARLRDRGLSRTQQRLTGVLLAVREVLACERADVDAGGIGRERGHIARGDRAGGVGVRLLLLALLAQRLDPGRALLQLQVLLRALHHARALALVEQVAPIAGLGEARLAVGARLTRLQRIDGLLGVGIGEPPAALADIGLRRALSERDGFLGTQVAGLHRGLDAIVERVEDRIEVGLVGRAERVADRDARGLRDIRPAGIARFRRTLAQDRVDAGFGEARHLLLEVRALHRAQDALRGVVERLQERLAIALRRGRVIRIARELLVDVELAGDEILLGRRAAEPVVHILDLVAGLSRDVAEALHRRADLARLIVRNDARGVGRNDADLVGCAESVGESWHPLCIARPSSVPLNARPRIPWRPAQPKRGRPPPRDSSLLAARRV